MKNTFIENLSNLFSQKSDREPKKDGDKNNKAIAKEPLKYIPLTPIKLDSEDAKHYITALNWAIDNEDTRNIALTGTYGSGKSSILKTFEKSNEDEKNKFLTISLANFSEVNSKQGNEKTNTKKAIREIQTGELEEQIFLQLHYTISNDKLPNSRFRKINNSTKFINRKFTFLFLFYLTCIFNVIQPKWILDAIKKRIYIDINPPYIILGFLFVLSLAFTFHGIFEFTRWIFKSFNNFQRIKVSFLDTEIESINEGTNSFLSQHLDEVLYFFEKTKKNIVIFEDLDRFNNTEIFIKLRELNSLINGYEPIINSGKGVKFIYAIRDDVFLSKDRTKFFDFIIPVIPVMNASNSYEILYNSFNGQNIENDLLSSISLFIDDRRLLNNTVNEFLIYKSVINSTLNTNKLLAIIVYKNLFPSNFEMLLNRDQNCKLFMFFEHYSSNGKLEDNYDEAFVDQFFNRDMSEADISKKDHKTEIELIRILIGGGYLGSDYLDYSLTFYPGRISSRDKQFLIDLKAHRKIDIGYKLDSPLLINDLLSVKEFGILSVENVSLVGSLLDSEKITDKDKITIFLNKIFLEPKNYLEFQIAMFKSEYTSTFVKLISYKWSDFWSYYYNQGNTENLELVYDLILQYSSPLDIVKFTDLNYLLDKFRSDKNLFSRLNIDIYRSQELLKSISIKFSNLDLSTQPSDIVNYIYESNYYQLNITMLERLYEFYSKELGSFNSANYLSINSSGLSELYNYISNDINEYVRNIYLKLPSNTQEDEDCMVALFNNHQISSELSRGIIDRWSNRFETLESRITENLKVPVSVALENFKVTPSWNNVLACLDFGSFESELVVFLNSEKVIDSLIDSLNDFKITGSVVNQEFIDFCINQPDFNVKLCVKLLKALEYLIPTVNVELGYERVEAFVENELYGCKYENLLAIQNPGTIEFNNLSYRYINNNLSYFINHYAHNLEGNDWIGLIKINNDNTDRLDLFMRFIPVEELDTDNELYDLIVGVFFKYYRFEEGWRLATKILLDGKGNELEKLTLFNTYHQNLNNSDYKAIFNKFGSGYDEILDNTKTSILPYSEGEYELFAKNLVALELILKYKIDKDNKIKLTKRKDV
jgi:hypothetical protein